MLYNQSQLLNYTAQLAGVQNSQGIYGFDTSTNPTIDLAINQLNDTGREICSARDYQFLENSKSYQFTHIISGVQSIYVSGTAFTGVSTGLPFSGCITPYPSDVLNYTWLADNSLTDINSGFANIIYTGLDIHGNLCSGLTFSGSVTTNTWTGLGYQYQLDPDIDKFLAPGIVIQHSNNVSTAQGIICQNVDYEDVMRTIPIGDINAQGTPSMFCEIPALGPTNGKVIRFFPFPIPSYSGVTFTVPYKKKWVDLVNSTDVQNCIPEQWQNVIIQGFLEKIMTIRTPDRAEAIGAIKENLINKMTTWDANQPSKMMKFRDANNNANVSNAYINTPIFHLDDSAWLWVLIFLPGLFHLLC